MFCNITVAPHPQMQWYKNKVLIEQNDSRIALVDGMKTLKIRDAAMEDNGKYKCVGKNESRYDERLINLKIIGRTEPKPT